MSHQPHKRTTHRPNYIALGIVLGTCFRAALESPAVIIIAVIVGIALDWRQRQNPHNA